MSSNPFRKKALGTIDTARASSPRSSLRSEDAQAGDRKNKPLKRVRVLSPPPLSPDSPEWSFDAPRPPMPLSENTYNHSNYYPSFDPFNGASTDESDGESIAALPQDKYQHQPQQQQQQHDVRSGGIPSNPFSKTLRDLEGSQDLQKERKEEGEVLKAANEGRKSLNVDSFKRLLMTGNADDCASSSASTDGEEETTKRNALSTAQTNARGRNYADPGSLADSSDEDEDKEESKILAVTSPASKEKKAPPPPPSSRHGKSLKQREPEDIRDDGHATAEPVRRSMDDDEARLDAQATNAAGGEVDARPQINSTPSFPGARKPAPAPPPPRGHARTDSKSHDKETPPRRTSSEDMPPRSDSTRSAGHAPAPPPPPRRPYLAPKQSRSSSPSTSSSNMASSTDQVQDIARSSHDSPTPSKPLIAPPPPPTRQPSTRRPPSVTGVDAPSRRVSSENKSRDTVPPPPPPPRHHGSSPNTDGRKVSGGAYAADPSKSADILADLDALQREVDALRGRMK
ncbi:hypothetical protein MAC_01473 [Metarhizium acridum CQMa 102]|uniref:Uncharacterized protein n=1 Tax=Metarhizium acridum (strain CQMa 102) TaxID=655827 RepID=E9DV83_METAQ|nr:uncharacterized protein MAC_01473 [Metarhizium acridum CQMa 102]EFY92507.1 hypothetical protein MAC_01473 [Metarhizium acridum CQMa 102]